MAQCDLRAIPRRTTPEIPKRYLSRMGTAALNIQLGTSLSFSCESRIAATVLAALGGFAFGAALARR